MVTFGVKKSEAPAVNSSGVWINAFKGGETVVRFIDEMDSWTQFTEHYNSDGHWYPCTKDSSCTGCSSSNEKERKKSTKYATNVYLVKTGDVRAYKIPITLANALERRAERNNGTITNRDYAILKSGSGMDTTYDVDQESRYELDLDDLRKQGSDIEDLLRERFEEVVGVTATQEGGEKEEFPFEEAAAEQSSAAVEIDIKQIQRMSIAELRDLAADADVDISEAEGKKEITASIIKALA